MPPTPGFSPFLKTGRGGPKRKSNTLGARTPKDASLGHASHPIFQPVQ